VKYFYIFTKYYSKRPLIGKYALLPLSFLPAQRKIFSCAGRNFSLPREQKIRNEVKEEVFLKNYYIFTRITWIIRRWSHQFFIKKKWTCE